MNEFRSVYKCFLTHTQEVIDFKQVHKHFHIQREEVGTSSPDLRIYSRSAGRRVPLTSGDFQAFVPIICYVVLFP